MGSKNLARDFIVRITGTHIGHQSTVSIIPMSQRNIHLSTQPRVCAIGPYDQFCAQGLAITQG
ncbi:Uncharacterised protein [Vibrio cholerae]|nr:Uncharacterised protein [Vibrio cholerae]